MLDEEDSSAIKRHRSRSLPRGKDSPLPLKGGKPTCNGSSTDPGYVLTNIPPASSVALRSSMPLPRRFAELAANKYQPECRGPYLVYLEKVIETDSNVERTLRRN